MFAAMWHEPYLESCCRSALHRLTLAGEAGRPADPKDHPCLQRLAEMDLARLRPDGRYAMTEPGRQRHAAEVAGRRMAV